MPDTNVAFRVKVYNDEVRCVLLQQHEQPQSISHIQLPYLNQIIRYPYHIAQLIQPRCRLQPQTHQAAPLLSPQHLSGLNCRSKHTLLEVPRLRH
jgi:hypothetical protein